MRSRDLGGVLLLAAAVLVQVEPAGAAPPKRKSLSPNEREAVLALIKAVDLAQATDTGSDPDLAWDHHVLKSANYTGYVPFALTPAQTYKATAMYVRAVSRHDGMRSSSEHSYLRDWGWESQAFASQTVPLQPFPPGQYELEVQVRDRLTRATAKASVAFTVTSGLR